MRGVSGASDASGGNVGKGFEMLPWDTAFFGFPTARVLGANLDERGLTAVLKAMSVAQVELAYWAVDPADGVSNQAGVACGAFLADERTIYTAVPPVFDPARLRARVAPIGAGDETPALYALAVEAGRHSRFNVDPGFPPVLFRALYVEWLRTSLSGARADAVLAAYEDGADLVQGAQDVKGAQVAKGFVTVQAKGGIGNIGLVAVDAGSRGKGLGTSLIQAALQWFTRRGCSIVEVATQRRNLAATRLYESNGFRVSGRTNVYHLRPLG